MGSAVGNPNPWPPYDTYKDCSQGLCSAFCPQWCYVIFPPPPPFSLFEEDDEGSSPNFSPLLIALVGILAGAFVLVTYYIIISKFCRRRGSSFAVESDRNAEQSLGTTWQGNDDPMAGLDDALIKSIAVYKYKKNDGFVDCTDCSVCLSEFEEDESLRLLPKCNHAFHVPCIDMWLKSHSNCPLCRANIDATSNTTFAAAPEPAGSNRSAEINVSALEYRNRSDDSVLLIEDLETGAQDEPVVSIDDGDEMQPTRRSCSLGSSPCNGTVSIADILREIEDDDEESIGTGSSMQRQREENEKRNQKNGVCSFLIRSSLGMRRSVSTERFFFTRYDRGSTCNFPI